MTTIIENICLESKYVNSNLLENLKEKIKEKYIGFCSQKYGYVIDVSDVEILRNRIGSTNSDVFFETRFSIKSLIPREGEIYIGKIFQIEEEGFFAQIRDFFTIFVPKTHLKKYTFMDEKFIHKKKTKLVLTVGKEVKLSIKYLRYENGSFSCIGTLMDEKEK